MLDHLILKRETPFSREQYQAMAIGDGAHFMPKITQRTRALSIIAMEYQWAEPVAFELKFEHFLVEGADGMTSRMAVRCSSRYGSTSRIAMATVRLRSARI
jgi:hypothetical protein